MGIHVARSNRGMAVSRSVRRPGEKVRPHVVRPGAAGGGSGKAKGGAQSGGSSGTTGNFGADFE
jgi:hypothetical protein